MAEGTLIFVDTDVLAREYVHKSDEKYRENSDFLEEVRKGGRFFTSIFNILELCAVAAHNLSASEIDQMFCDLHCDPSMQVLYPLFNNLSAKKWFSQFFITQTYPKLKNKMPLPDTIIANIAESHGSSQFVTWNTKHFQGKTCLEVLSPSDYLKKYSTL